MKIGIVSPYAYPRPGGANDNIRETYENLRERGHQVRIITAPWGDDPPAQDVIQIGQAIAVPYNGSVGRITLSARLEYLVTRILDRKSCPQVATFHAFGGFSFSYWAFRGIAQRYMSKLDGRIAVSSAARHFVSRYFPGDYRIIPNGVDVDFFASAKPFPEYRDGKTNILFVGRVEPRKGALYLARAYAKLKQRYPDTRLIVIGGGPELGDLRRWVHKQQVKDVLFAGRVSDADKARFYKTADVFCAPSTGQESFGVVLLEAMAAGTAAVASDIHGYKKVIQRNVSGLLVEPKDVDALCSALERLVNEPALRKRLGEAGSIRAREFDWSHVTDQLLGFYDEVIRGYRGA